VKDYKSVEIKVTKGRLFVALWYHDGNCETYDTVCSVWLNGVSEIAVTKNLKDDGFDDLFKVPSSD
jgi:hypothetical protein